MEKRILGIDFDGTLADTVPMTLKLLNKRYNKNFDVGDVRKYWFNDLYNLTRDELNGVFAELLVQTAEVSLVDPRIPEILNKYSEDLDIYIVTATVAKKHQILDWVEEKGIHVKDVVIFQKKSEFKDMQLLIDDSPYNANDVALAGKRVILLKKQYYVYGDEINHKNISFADNWSEAEKHVDVFFGYD